MNLRIGFDGKRIVKNATGLGNYCRTLVSELSALTPPLSLRLYVPSLGRDDLRSQLSHVSAGFVLPRTAKSKIAQAWWRYRGIVSELQADGIELFHGLSGELPCGLRKAGIPAVVTIHDLIFLRHPEYYNPIDVAIYRHKFHLACREATKIVAISECTKRDVMHFGQVSEERIEVVYQSCEPAFAVPVPDVDRREVLRHYGLSEGYVLSVGSIEERKNAMLTLEAIAQTKDLRLLLVGRPTPYAERLRQRAERLGLAERFVMLHGVPSAHLPALYRSASVFAYPSRYEGFGIPIIEALCADLPVIGATGSCLEEAGGPDQIYVHPDDTTAMATHLQRLVASPAESADRAEKGKAYAQRFLNNQQANRLRTIYEQVVSAHQHRSTQG